MLRLILPAAALAALFACTGKTVPDAVFSASACDASALGLALDAGTPGTDAVLAACPGDDARAALAGGATDSACLTAAADRAAIRACAPALGSVGEVVLAAGDPRVAARAHAWLVAQGVDEATATRAALAIRGAPVAAGPDDLVLPVATGPAPAAATHVLGTAALAGPSPIALVEGRFPDPSTPSGLHPFPRWRVEGIAANESATVVADARVRAATFGRLAASAVRPGGKLTLVGVAGDALASVSVGIPAAQPAVTARPRGAGVDLWRDGARIAPVGTCAADGPSACDAAALATWRAANAGPLGVAVSEGATVADLAALLAFVRADAVLDLAAAPCRPGPADMVCVAGGPTALGRATGPAGETPPRTAEISTFWLDRREVTQAEYQRCVAAGFCAPVGGKAPDQPVVGLSRFDAVRYCSWSGKRLPTEWEWEKAARGPAGEAFPWGDAAPACDKARGKECGFGAAGPADPDGFSDLLGNASEWTGSFTADPRKACVACAGRDPKGLCDALDKCPNGVSVVRGGSAFEPLAALDASARSAVSSSARVAGAGIRCATSNPWTAAFPPAHLTTPYPTPPEPAEPTAAERAIASGVVADSLEDKGICGEDVRQYWSEKHKKGGHSTIECRDPISYITPNEPRAYVFRRYVTNVGGGYVGVASDTNLSLIAAARSEWAWLMDYDPNVVRVHKVIRAVMLKSPTPEAFVAHFAPGAVAETQQILDEAYGDDPQAQMIVALYTGRRAQLYRHYQNGLTAPKGDPAWGWLSHPDQYAYVKRLYEQGRINILGGDLLAAKSMTGIGDAARKLGVPIRIYYPSNAPSAWGGQATPQHKANILALPMDERSLYITTTNKGAYAQTGYWHNLVISGWVLQERFRSPALTNVRQVWWDRIPTDDGDTTMTGVAGR